MALFLLVFVCMFYICFDSYCFPTIVLRITMNSFLCQFPPYCPYFRHWMIFGTQPGLLPKTQHSSFYFFSGVFCCCSFLPWYWYLGIHLIFHAIGKKTSNTSLEEPFSNLFLEHRVVLIHLEYYWLLLPIKLQIFCSSFLLWCCFDLLGAWYRYRVNFSDYLLLMVGMGVLLPSLMLLTAIKIKSKSNTKRIRAIICSCW